MDKCNLLRNDATCKMYYKSEKIKCKNVACMIRPKEEKMDDRIKKNHKNELLEDIRKIVKKEMEKTYIPCPMSLVPPEPKPRWDNDITVTWTTNL